MLQHQKQTQQTVLHHLQTVHQQVHPVRQAQVEVHQLQINRGKGTPMDAAAARNGYADVFTPGQVFSAKSPT